MNSPPHHAAIALGSNLGDRAAALRRALQLLSGTPGIQVVRASTPIETPPVGPVPQGPYLNAAAVLATSLAPRELLNELLRIEASMGRTRGVDEVRWGPRVIDLDLILYDERMISEPGLIVPHPRCRGRAFVLVPLASVAPDWRVPPDNRTVGELLASLDASGDRPRSSHSGPDHA